MIPNDLKRAFLWAVGISAGLWAVSKVTKKI